MLNKELIEQKARDLDAKADRIRDIAEVYGKVEDDMKWYAMEYHDVDDEHEEKWFTEPEEGSYKYNKYLAYKEVLEAIEKLINSIK